ncbi:MAG: hypothetical protein KA146_12570, partial [Leptospiraceae bacterium]|nr:hypothetical protein [Leptospiraceae bacterium]
SFISSDNPVLRTNPNFKNGQPVDDPETEFTIPLTSKIAVSLYKYDHNFTFSTMQNRIEIENINQSFAKNAYNTIFGSSKELIENLVKLIPMKEVMKLTTQEIIKELKKANGDKYDYSKGLREYK